MRFMKGPLPTLIAILCSSLAINLHVHAQKPPTEQNPAQARQKIRANAGLVRTDVMVFDKQGQFVPDLMIGQFELRINGKKQPIEYFDLVSAGSARDRAIWAKTEGQPLLEQTMPGSKASDPGRTLLIFLDDWHMAADNTITSRNAVSNLLNTSIGPNDRVGIVSASGQLAATQLLTDDRVALLSSLEKYKFQSPGVMDVTNPPMTEAQALLIEQNDHGALAYFLGSILGVPVVQDYMGRWQPSGEPPSSDFTIRCNLAETEIRRRAAALLQTYLSVSQRTLSALLDLLRDAESLPGRKLVFFLSDGFILQHQRSDIESRLADLCTAAARAGILIYTLDSRGLVSGAPDAKTANASILVPRRRGINAQGATTSMIPDETSASWDTLNVLAVDTGGRFLKNADALDTAVTTTLTESSRYYLLGWHIDPQKLKPGNFITIKASIKRRPDLSVRVRQGSLEISELVVEKSEN